MKKILMLLFFFAGAACFITAGLRFNRQQSGMLPTEERRPNSRQPELLSDVNMSAYVSLPASFSNIDIVENLDDISVTEDNVEDIMYEKLLDTATHLAKIDRENVMLVANYTITKDNAVQDVQSGFRFGYKSKSLLYDETVFKALAGTNVGTPIHLEHVFFNGNTDCNLDITVTEIFNMPYPVTDKYVSSKTEYSSVTKMKSELLNDASGEAKAIARRQTISSLIDIMMGQTTFIRLPDSLLVKELEVLQKDNPVATYDEAKDSLRRIFFIAAVIKEYNIATNADMEKRYNNLPETERLDLDEYSAERKKYQLYEEDVVTCIYRKVNISETEQQD